MLVLTKIQKQRSRNVSEFKKTTTATATGTSRNNEFQEHNNGCARVL